MAKDVKIEIVGDASKYKAALADASASSDKFSGKTRSNGEEMSKFGLGALAVGAALGVGLFKAGEAASNLGESINAVQVTFGKSAAGILKLGEDAATAVGLSNTAFNGLAVQFSSFAQTIAGKGNDVTATMKEMTGRAADFASVMNIDVAEAARLFQSGLAGETEPLKKFGIDLSAAAVTAYAAANGIGEVGKQLTESEKVTARYGLLMESTSKTQGDFANTSDSAANATRVAKAEMENAAAALGSVVAPVMAEVASKAAMLAKGFVSVNEATGGMLVGFTALVGGGALVLGTITSVIGRFQKMSAVMHTAEGGLTTTGKVMQGLVPIAAVAGVAFFGLSQRANHAADELRNIAKAADELATAADGDVVDSLMKAIIQGVYAGQSLDATMKQLAETNIDGAKRALALAEAQGVEENVLVALRQAIAEKTRAEEQGKKTTDAATAATEASTAASEDTAAATDAVAAADKLAKGALEALKAAQEEATRVAKAHSDALQVQIDKLDALYPKQYDAVKAKYDFADAQAKALIDTDKLNKSLVDSKATAEDQAAAFDTARDSIIGASEKYGTMEGAASGSEGAIRRQIESLKAQEVSLAPGSPLRAFLDQYIADLNNIPSNISTIMDLHISQGSATTAAGDVIGKRSGHFATGGIVEATPGGRLIVAGEGGVDEAVIPLDGKHSLGGGGGTVNVTIMMPVGTNGDDVVNAIKRFEQRNGAGWRS